MRYRPFGVHTGLRVSEIVLGSASFGTRWGYGAAPEEARLIFDTYADAGGNFIDTADSYQAGQSEEILGELLTGRRNDFVLATKFSMTGQSDSSILLTGNSRKAMVASVEASLGRLKTDRIDIYWAHMPDNVTPIEEIMRGFEDLSRAGKILYAGLSNFPAWRIARAATMSELRGSLPLAGIQFEHSLIERSAEQELLPAAEALGLGAVAWSPLGGGVLTGKYRNGESGRAQGMGGRIFHPENTPQRSAIIDMVITVAEETDATPGEIALAWVTAKGSLPIIGPRTLAQATSNLAAAELELSSDQINRLDTASHVPQTYPHNLINDPATRQRIASGKDALLTGPILRVS